MCAAGEQRVCPTWAPAATVSSPRAAAELRLGLVLSSPPLSGVWLHLLVQVKFPFSHRAQIIQFSTFQILPPAPTLHLEGPTQRRPPQQPCSQPRGGSLGPGLGMACLSICLRCRPPPTPNTGCTPPQTAPPVGQTRQEPRPFQTAPKPTALRLRLNSLSLVEKGGLEVPGFRIEYGALTY